MNHIYNLQKLAYNREALLDESLSLNYDHPIDYDVDPLNSDWLKTRITDDQTEANELWQFFNDLLGVKVIPLYYIQPARSPVVKHIDTLCSCSINIVLDRKPTQPVIFHDSGDEYTYFYRCALLNVSGYYHEVPPSEEDRRILRFAISVKSSYEETLNKLKEGVLDESS